MPDDAFHQSERVRRELARDIGRLRDQLADQKIALAALRGFYKGCTDTLREDLEDLSDRLAALEGKPRSRKRRIPDPKPADSPPSATPEPLP